MTKIKMIILFFVLLALTGCVSRSAPGDNIQTVRPITNDIRLIEDTCFYTSNNKLNGEPVIYSDGQAFVSSCGWSLNNCTSGNKYSCVGVIKQ